MKTASRTLTLVLALGLLLVLWLVRPNTASGGDQSDALSFELQNGSFSPLTWSIAQFKLYFSKEYGDLLLRLDTVRAPTDDLAGALKDAHRLWLVTSNN